VRNIGKLGGVVTAGLVVLAMAQPAALATVVAIPAGGALAGGALADGVPADGAPADGVPAAGGQAFGPAVRQACARPSSPQWAQCLALVRTNVVSHLGASPDSPPPGYGPASLRSAYGLAGAAASSGNGRTVALVDAFDDPDAQSDLAIYRSQFGLPSCTTANGCFRKLNQAGAASPLPAAAGSNGWATEESLDLDMVSAICPKCHIMLVEADSAQLSDLGAAVDTAVSLGARYVSNSYAAPESAGDSTFEADFHHPGVALTASAGDDGFGVNYPASSRYVTAVGGTTLTTASGTARGWKETVWAGTGSGCSTREPRPAWQAGSCSRRTVADVAADANPATGVAVYVTYPSLPGWTVLGGTSVSSPVIAATYALAGLPGRGDVPAWYPYRHRSQLNDVTSGSNGSCSRAYLCHGEHGYDGPTGLGTPHGTGAFVAGRHTVKVKSPGTRTSVKGSKIKPVKITAVDQDPVQQLTYRAMRLPAGLSVSSAGVISGRPAKLGSSKVTVRATDKTGTSGSVTFSWRVESLGVVRSGLSATRCITDRGGRAEIVRCGSNPLRWLVFPRANGTFTIALAKAHRTCLTVAGARTGSGTKVVAGKCGSSTSQQWRIGGHGHLVGQHSGKCLADPAAGPNGTQLVITACRNTAAQHWNLP
jgi:hypothetical protein